MPANRQKTGARKPNAGSFKKSDKRINRTGRPPIPEDVKQAMRELHPKALRRLAELLEDDNKMVAMKAVELIVERNLGKTPQSIELTGKNGGPLEVRKVDPSKLSIEQLRQFRELIALATPTAQA